jgi:hypothetical protein
VCVRVCAPFPCHPPPQLRIEQSGLERVQAVNRRLQDELLAAHEELKQARGENDAAATRHAQNIELLKVCVCVCVCVWCGGVLWHCAGVWMGRRKGRAGWCVQRGKVQAVPL